MRALAGGKALRLVKLLLNNLSLPLLGSPLGGNISLHPPGYVGHLGSHINAEIIAIQFGGTS